MLQLVHVVRARCTDHSNPLGQSHHLVFVDSDSDRSPEYGGGHGGNLYQVKLAGGTLDAHTISVCFELAEKAKANGDIFDPKC